MSNRLMVTIEATDFGSFRVYDEGISVADLLRAIERVPEAHRATAMLAIQVSGDYASASVSMTYMREETDGERQKRERDEAERRANADRQNFERERAEYERLKAKFER